MRTPTVLQMEAVECGAAALAIVLGHHGRFVPLEELRVVCGVSRDGSNAKRLLLAARHYGLTAKAMRYSVDTLRKTAAPFIVFWNFNHFLVVEGFRDDTVFLNDPATGRRRVPIEEFDKAYTGVTLVFEKGPSFEASGKPPSVWGAVTRRLAASPGALALLALLSVLSAVPIVLTAAFARILVDEVLIGGQREWLVWLVLAAGLTLAAFVAVTLITQNTARMLETKLALAGAGRLVWHIVRLPHAFFTQRMAGDIVSRLRSSDTATRTIVRDVALAFSRLVGAAVFVLVIALTNVWIALLTIAFAAVSIVVTMTSLGRIRDASASLEIHEAKVFADTAMAVGAIETIRATATERAAFERWAGHHAVTINTEQALSRHVALLRALPPLTDGLALALVVWLGALAVIDGTMTVGGLVAVVALLAAIREPVQGLASTLASLEGARAAFTRIDDVVNADLDETFGPEQVPATAITGKSRLSGRIELIDVTFGYSPTAPALIENLNLTIEPGARVALVGGTGSGKSTVAKLVAGLFRPWSGEILFDGVPPEKIPRWLLKTSLGWVDQDTALFAASVRENLTLWDDSVPEGVLARAARDAAIYDTIAARDGGFEHRVLEDGANFSGGEAQRLQIARAFVLEPSIVIFDEATSALDPVLERTIDRNLRRRGVTALIVAHRLSTIRDCDEIIVFSKGQVVERGTHDELVERKGVYLDLIRT